MADVLIRGMEMPESCDKCRLFNECWCMALGIEDWRKSYNKPPEGERLPDCPLVPLPEGHGDLIDRDALRKEIDANRPGRSYEDGWALTVMDHAPTVVPAEGGTENG